MSSLPASAQVASSPSEDAQPDGRPARGSTAHRPKPGRKVYLDCINVLAIIGVVALHNRFNYRVDYDSPGWVLENILSGTAVAAVPLFFMASGITLLNFTERESRHLLQEALHENPGSPADLGADLPLRA